MKIIKTICAVILSVFMFGYMVIAAVLFSVDLSLDEKYIQGVLDSSDSFAQLVHKAEISINDEFEDNAEEIVESFGGDAEDISLREIYSMPEATALFADIFTGSARYVLYGEEYAQVNEELIKDYLCAVANYGSSRDITGEEMEDYLSVGLESYSENFNNTVRAMVEIYEDDAEMLDTIRFIFNDLKFAAMASTVIHMLVLILLIRGKIGYFFNAAVFGLGGLTVLSLGGGMEKVLDSMIGNDFARIVTEIFDGRFQLIGAVLFAIFAVLMLLALLVSIRRTKQEENNGKA